ncbi:MAG: hypothetical protein D4R45_03415 [Planctomycetaceae bacterium]|nr:MAG: hypothetical protein D4R45_03415 [Planctomycetaceae bacterium]
MKCKFGAIVVDGRNKLGGHVASKNRAGAYWRTKVTPMNPGSTYQVNVRNRFSGLSSAWRGLEDAERKAWNAAVSDFKKTDIFGDTRNPSGFNLHQKLNNNLLNIGIDVITTPPLPEAIDAFTTLSVAASFSGQTLTVTFADIINATHRVFLLATPGLSPGITFVKSEFRQITYLNSANTSPFSAETAYIVKFGAVPAANMKIFVRLIQVNLTTGQAGIPIQASCIVAA